jgi:hypothetical protein
VGHLRDLPALHRLRLSVCGLGVCGRETLLGLSKQALGHLELEYHAPFGVGSSGADDHEYILPQQVAESLRVGGVDTCVEHVQEHDHEDYEVYHERDEYQDYCAEIADLVD